MIVVLNAKLLGGNNMITRDMIKKALFYKEMEIVDNNSFDNENRNTSGICCKIGNYAFYFGSGKDFYKISEMKSIEEYWKSYSMEQTADMLYDILNNRFNAIEKYGLDSNEYDFYVAVITECNNRNEKNIDYYAIYYMELLKEAYSEFAYGSDANTKPYLEKLLPDLYSIQTIDEWNNSAVVREFQDIIKEHKISEMNLARQVRAFTLDDYVGYWCLKYHDNLEVGIEKLADIVEDMHGIDFEENYKILARLQTLQDYEQPEVERE